MGAYALEELETTRSLVNAAQGSDEPIIMFDGEDECLVAMRPAVFERILFDTDLLNAENRSTFRL